MGLCVSTPKGAEVSADEADFNNIGNNGLGKGPCPLSSSAQLQILASSSTTPAAWQYGGLTLPQTTLAQAPLVDSLNTSTAASMKPPQDSTPATPQPDLATSGHTSATSALSPSARFESCLSLVNAAGVNSCYKGLSEAGRLGGVHCVLTHGMPRPANDEGRTAALAPLALNGADIYPELELLTRVVTQVFGAKYSAVSLFSSAGCWNVAATKMPKGLLPWTFAACPWMLLTAEPMTLVCEKFSEDARFEHQTYARNGLQTYLSSPMLASNGHRMGSICVLDDIVHRVDAGYCRMLNNFAEVAVRELERCADLPRKLEDRTVHQTFMSDTELPVRNLVSAQSSCTVLLDTAVPGWEILYTSRAWEQWTGMKRESCLGRTLADVLESGIDGTPLRWEDLVLQAHACIRFVVPKLRSRGGGSAADAAGSARMFDLGFRPVSLEALDNDTLPVGIPSFVPMESSLQRIYAAKFHTVNTSAPTKPLATATKLNASQASPTMSALLMFTGLKLGHVLGRGGYGTVYHATWHGAEVVVKVQDYLLMDLGEHREAELEICLAEKLACSSVVRLLAHASIQLERGRTAAPQRPLKEFFIDDIDDVRDVWSSSGSLCSGDMLSMALCTSASAAGSTPKYGSVFSGAKPSGGGSAACSDATALQKACGTWAAGLEVTRSAFCGGHATTSGTSGTSGISQCEGNVGPTSEPPAALSDASLSQGAGGPPAAANPAAPAASVAAASAGSGASIGATAGGTSVDSTLAAAEWATSDVIPSVKRTESGMAAKKAAMQSNAASLPLPTHATAYPLEIRCLQVLEFCDKGCLQDAIDRGWLRTSTTLDSGPSTLAILATALEIANGLVMMHGMNIAHGDLTAFNVLLKSFGKLDLVRGCFRGTVAHQYLQDVHGREFSAKIADFGKSRVLGTKEYIKTSSYGTMTHMPPEVLRNGLLGRPADVYAFGVLLWAMWTGARPWGGMTHAQVLSTVVHGRATLTYPEGTPADIQAFGDRCLSYKASERPTIGGVVEQLKAMFVVRKVPVPGSEPELVRTGQASASGMEAA